MIRIARGPGPASGHTVAAAALMLGLAAGGVAMGVAGFLVARGFDELLWMFGLALIVAAAYVGFFVASRGLVVAVGLWERRAAARIEAICWGAALAGLSVLLLLMAHGSVGLVLGELAGAAYGGALVGLLTTPGARADTTRSEPPAPVDVRHPLA